MDFIMEHDATPSLVILGARLGALRDAAQSAGAMFAAVRDEVQADEKAQKQEQDDD